MVSSPMSTSPATRIEVHRGDAPSILSLPHAGTGIPAEIAPQLVSPWLATLDTDWYIRRLYDFATDLGATVIGTSITRAVIDVNRDPGGASLYPGQSTTDLCPVTTFDGDLLYRHGKGPEAAEIDFRRLRYFEPYHAALRAELERLRADHGTVVLYDAHSIRSRVPRLFDGNLPHLNLGTHSARSCSPDLTAAVESRCARLPFSRVTNGRFKGGYITRHYGRPDEGVHAIQMELACRSYLQRAHGRPGLGQLAAVI